MKNIVYKIKLIIYYILINRLPNSRIFAFSNIIRLWYFESILNIKEKCPNNGVKKIEAIQNNIYISRGVNVTIGYGCQINENVFIQGAKIGRYVMIAPNVSILSSEHNYISLAKPMALQGKIEEKYSIIEDDVWVGRNVIIMPGIRIGKGSIIGAGAIVTKNVESYSIMAGIPAKKIRSRL